MDPMQGRTQDFSEGGYMPCLMLDNLQYNSYVQDDNKMRNGTERISCVYTTLWNGRDGFFG